MNVNKIYKQEIEEAFKNPDTPLFLKLVIML